MPRNASKRLTLLIFTLTLALPTLLGIWTLRQESSRGPSASAEGHHQFLTTFRGGSAKQLDDGRFDVYCSQSSTATAWIWVENDTRDGDGLEYWVFHDSFAFPGPANDNMEMEFDYDSTYVPTTLAGFKAWIVANHSHVQSENELTVHQCDVSLVP